MTMTWLFDIFRSLCFIIDEVIYKLIGSVYQLFMEIANTTIFTNDIFELFQTKVYALLGIFMLFKVSFSILSYIVNPDEFTDKNKGLSKLASNIIIALIMLIAVPIAFNQAMDIQRIILKDNVIPRIFSTKDYTAGFQDLSVGVNMASETFSAFYYPADKENYVWENIYEAFATDVNKKDSDNNYYMEYKFGFSTLAGALIVLLLVNFCFDIALRSVKLGFLRMIAPVPIVAKVDPKKGNDIFNKWLKTCIGTYLDLFTRLIAMSFAMFIIGQVGNLNFTDAVTGEQAQVNVLTKVFIIFGALLFVKQLPKLIEDILGIKLSGNFSLNPFKQVAKVPLAGAVSNKLIGGAQRAVGYWNNAEGFGNKLKGLGKGFASGFVNNKNISFLGDDGKKSILDTADRKINRELKEKRDYTKQMYESKMYQKDLDKQIELGKEYDDKIASAGNKAFKKAIDNGMSEDDAKLAKKNAEAATEKKLYGTSYFASKSSVDAAKAEMYAWKNKETEAEEMYREALSTNNKDIIDRAYKELENVRQISGKAAGQYEYRKKIHESVKKQNPTLANIEDSIEAYQKTGGKEIDRASEYKSKDRNLRDDIINNNQGGLSNGGSSSNQGGSSNGGRPSNPSGPSSGGNPSNPSGPSNGGTPNNQGGSSNGGSSSNQGDSSNGGNSGSQGSSSNGGEPNNQGGPSSDGRPDNQDGPSNNNQDEYTNMYSSNESDDNQEDTNSNEAKMSKEELIKYYYSKKQAKDLADQKDNVKYNAYIDGYKSSTDEAYKEKLYREKEEAEAEKIAADDDFERAINLLKENNVEIPKDDENTDENTNEEVKQNTYVNNIKYSQEQIDKIKNSESYKKANVCRIKVDTTVDDIHAVAIRLMQLKENGIHAICDYNGIRLDNDKYSNIDEIQHDYQIRINY